MSEAIAILRGIQLALDSGLSPCMIESDVEVVVKWINMKEPILSEIGNIISDIHGLQVQARCLSIEFVPRMTY